MRGNCAFPLQKLQQCACAYILDILINFCTGNDPWIYLELIVFGVYLCVCLPLKSGVMRIINCGKKWYKLVPHGVDDFEKSS